MASFLTQDQILTIIGIIIACIVLSFFIKLIRIKNKIIANNKKINAEKQKSENIIASYAAEESSWLNRLRDSLTKTRQQLSKNIDNFFLTKAEKITLAESLEYLFEMLISADVGVNTAEILIERIKNRFAKNDLKNLELFKDILKEEILTLISISLENKNGTIENIKYSPHVILMVGVNGTGKTTTTGKLAYSCNLQGKKVLIGAADTFRAAAVKQLSIWAERSSAQLIQLKEGSDPASVAYRATQQALEQKIDICLIDTAGRLQTRQDLMQELSKIYRVSAKDVPDAPHEVLLVLDATTGQNAIEQAKLFRQAVNITGIILTKLDGTAKGGVAIAIIHELGIPIRYIGIGEGAGDLELFNAKDFVNALFG